MWTFNILKDCTDIRLQAHLSSLSDILLWCLRQSAYIISSLKYKLRTEFNLILTRRKKSFDSFAAIIRCLLLSNEAENNEKLVEVSVLRVFLIMFEVKLKANILLEAQTKKIGECIEFNII